MKSLLTPVFLFVVNTNLGYIAYFHMQIKISQTYLLGLRQNQMPWGFALVNPTTDRKIVLKQRA